MVTTIPQPLDDQTIESLVAVALSRTPWPIWNVGAHSIFDAPGIRIGSFVHHGVMRCFQTFGGFGYQSPDALVARHCPLPLLKPFLDVLLYESVQRLMIEGWSEKLHHVYRLHAIAPELRFCRSCIEADARQHGYGYARRAHQINGVQVCHAHGRPLHRLEAEQSDHFARHGVLMLSLEGAVSSWNLLEIPLSGSHSVAMKYAGFAAAALTGMLQPTTTASRQLAYLERLRTRPGGDRSAARTLTRELRREFGDTLLSELELDPTDGPSASWPALVLDGPYYSQHPLANLMVMAILFDEPDDFRLEVCRKLECQPAQDLNRTPKILPLPTKGLTLQLIKSLLRDPSLNSIASEYGMIVPTLEERLRVFPKLAQRRPEALWRQKRRHARSVVRRLLRQKPSATQSDLIEMPMRQSYSWLLLYDEQWLHAAVPSAQAVTKPEQPQATCYDAILDHEVAGHIANLLGRPEADGSQFPRRSLSHLMSLLPQDIQTAICEGRLPITEASLESLEESKSGHCDRCIVRICHLLLCGDKESARTWARELFFAYPDNPEVHNRVLAAMPSVESEKPAPVAI